MTADTAAKIAALAKSKMLTVQVGHQERMVFEAIGLLSLGEPPLKIEAVRNSPYSLRGTDASVTFDLMTHDIDLCTAVMGCAPDEVAGLSGCVRSTTADMSYGRLRYGTTIVRLTASRVVEQSERWMKLTYASGEVCIDFNAKTLKNTTKFALNEKFGESEMARDSLGAATDSFVRAVLDGDAVIVSAEDGRIAVQVAEHIDRGE
jgi:predicted dehydrogenase